MYERNVGVTVFHLRIPAKGRVKLAEGSVVRYKSLFDLVRRLSVIRPTFRSWLSITVPGAHVVRLFSVFYDGRRQRCSLESDACASYGPGTRLPYLTKHRNNDDNDDKCGFKFTSLFVASHDRTVWGAGGRGKNDRRKPEKKIVSQISRIWNPWNWKVIELIRHLFT